MTTLGFLALGFGVLTVWAGLVRVNVFDILRSFIGAPVPTRNEVGQVQSFTAGGAGMPQTRLA